MINSVAEILLCLMGAVSIWWMHATLDEWMLKEAVSLSDDSAALDALVRGLGDGVDLLGFGEALHGGEEMLMFRNRLFKHLVASHGYRAIAMESSFTRGRVLNAFLAGQGPATSEEACHLGFSHGFGKVEANRELVEWMRAYNEDPAHEVKLRFYGFDLPLATAGPASPRQVLEGILDFFAKIDPATELRYRERILPHLGEDASWENPMIWRDPVQSADLLAAVTALRAETEDLMTELQVRRPEWVKGSSREFYAQALHDVTVVRQLLNFYMALARDTGYTAGLSVRDAMMADNLVYILACEQERGRVMAFAHNAHLQRGKVELAMGSQVCQWWPAGAHVHEMLGARYAVIGSALSVSEVNGIGEPEAGSLEAKLSAFPGPVRFIPTHQGQGLPGAEMGAVLPRTGSQKNRSYIPLNAQSFSDFDAWVVFDQTGYTRGANPLPA